MRFLDLYQKMDREQRIDFARRVGTSPAYLSHIAYGHRLPGGALTLAILKEAGGEVDFSFDSFGPEPTRPAEAA